MTLLRSFVPAFGRVASPQSQVSAASKEASLKPVYTVREDEHGYEITVQLPGVAKTGLEITAQEGEIKIAGRRDWTLPVGWTAIYRETPRANFELALSYGNDVDTEKIGAELKQGLLQLILPKAEAAKPRKININ